ncbi:TPR-like protein [Marasmius fiardii PR-910]|nr:TPR-like protein [Marasmius fiardii PR-910]
MSSHLRVGFSVARSTVHIIASQSRSRACFPPRVLGSTSFQRNATSTTPHSLLFDPGELEASRCTAEGTRKLKEGDARAAKRFYKRSAEIKRNANSLFNLGITHYQLSTFWVLASVLRYAHQVDAEEFDEAIDAWKESIELQPQSADVHANLASAYITSPLPRADLALHHLHIASSLSPEDPEIAFNLATILEATGRLEQALEHYKRSREFGAERAVMHIQNVTARLREMQESNGF